MYLYIFSGWYPMKVDDVLAQCWQFDWRWMFFTVQGFPCARYRQLFSSENTMFLKFELLASISLEDGTS